MKKKRSTFDFMQGNVRVLTLCRVLWTISLSITYPYFSLYILALGGSPTTIGLVNALGSLAGLILYPVGGYIADHRGRVKLVSVFTYIFAFTFIFFIVAQNWEMLAVGYFLQQLVLFYMPAIYAIMVDSLPPGQRGIGFATTMAIPGAIGIIAPYMGGYLISLYGGGHVGVRNAMRVCYTAGLALGMLVATIRAKFLKETLKESRSTVSLHDIPSLFKKSYISVWKSLIWMPQILRSLAAIQVLTILFVSLAAPFWVVYAVEVIELTEYEWGFLMLLVGIVQTILTIPLGHLTDRYGPRRMILAAMIISPAPVFLFVFCKTFLAVLATLITLALVNAITRPAFLTLMAEIIPQNRRGRLLAIMGQDITITWGQMWVAGFLSFIPATIGSLVGGYIYGVNPQYPWFILTIALILCLVLGFRFIREPRKLEVQKPPKV